MGLHFFRALVLLDISESLIISEPDNGFSKQ